MNFTPAKVALDEIAWQQQGESWSGRMTCGAAPVQIDGMIGDRFFYFRSRYTRWEFGIADGNLDNAVAVSAGWDEGFRLTESYGESEYAASWMPHEEAWQIVARCIAEYRLAS